MLNNVINLNYVMIVTLDLKCAVQSCLRPLR